MALAAGVLAICAFAARTAPCWGLFIFVALTAFPVWLYRTEYLLLRRRLVLSGVSLPQSRMRLLLWKGQLTRGFQVIVSVLLAWLLLVLVSPLAEEHWYALTADSVLLGLMIGPVTRRLQGDITPGHLGAVARRWPLFLINGFVLTAAIVSLDFYIVGTPDTRHMEWHRVAEQAFATVNADSGCVLWGISAGFLAAAEALSWHGSSLIIPSLPDRTTMLIGWLFFLLRAGTVAYLFTALLLGVALIVEERDPRRRARARESTVSRAFFLTIVLLALPFFYAAIKLGQVDPSALVNRVGDVAQSIDPCQMNPARRAQLIARLDADVSRERQHTLRQIDSTIDRELERVFEQLEMNVDGYLDWYFTVAGEYQRLAAVFAEDVTSAMTRKLEEHLLAGSDFDARLSHLKRRLDQIPAERFAALIPHLGTRVEQVPCDVGSMHVAALTDLDADKLRASAAATSGAGAGILASKALAKKTAAAVAGKVAAKKSLQTGATLASKTLAKKGTSSALSAWVGTSVCAPTGPVAILCGITAGVATWLAVDTALVELDETLSRDEMRAEILKTLDEQKAALGERLKRTHHARVDQMAARVNDAVQRTFIPYSDGVHP
ncbi:MAG: hypothetical protein PVG38_15500 [Gammaproteobacteria bacterium]|jgi:hypothetical protein